MQEHGVAPDPKKHLNISLLKSFVRIVGYTVVGFSIPATQPGMAVLLIAEFIGIVEELV